MFYSSAINIILQAFSGREKRFQCARSSHEGKGDHETKEKGKLTQDGTSVIY